MQTFFVTQHDDSRNWALVVAPDSVKALDTFDALFPDTRAGSAWPLDDGQTPARLNTLVRQGNFLGHFTYKTPAFYRADDDHRDIYKADGRQLLLSCMNVEDSEFVLQALLAYKEP